MFIDQYNLSFLLFPKEMTEKTSGILLFLTYYMGKN